MLLALSLLGVFIALGVLPYRWRRALSILRSLLYLAHNLSRGTGRKKRIR